MKILYLIGNGLDLSIGMKTAYKDFYKSISLYMDFEPQSLVSKMLEEINTDIDRWSDMESALGQFTSITEYPEDFIELLEFINSHLKEYLLQQQTEVNVREYKNTDVRYLARPERNFGPVTKSLYKKVLGYEPDFQNAIVDIITFNYTNTLERFFKTAEKGLPIELKNPS